MSADILVKNVRLVDGCKDQYGDLYIQNGVISSVGKCPDVSVSTLDGDGQLLVPSFVDLHSHFRDPGNSRKENIYSGSMAAIAGGYTTVSLMANTDPICDCPEVASYIQKKADKLGLIEVFVVGAITGGLLGEELSDMDGLAPHVWAFSDDGAGVQDSTIFKRACEKAASLGLPLIEHCESTDLSEPGLSEALMVARDILLAKHAGCRLHIAHISAIDSVRLLSWGKSSGIRVTGEVTPHHLCLDDEIDYKVNPPLIDSATQSELVRGLGEGTIDAIATDHAPHTREDKQQGAPGISGIETAFSLLYSQLVNTGRISLMDLIERMSRDPARILGLKKGRLEAGYDGDVTLIAEDESFVVTERALFSKGKNSPLIGRSLTGKIEATIHKGEVVYVDGKIKGVDFDDYRQIV